MTIDEMNYKFQNCKLEDLWYMFFGLSDTAFVSVESSVGKKGAFYISCEAAMSVMNTLQTIDFCCVRNAYADAYTLVRKIRDDLLQYLFLLAVIQRNTGLQEDELGKISFDVDKILEMIESDFKIKMSGERKEKVDFALESWAYNELEQSDKNAERKEFFDTSKYKKYLIESNLDIKFLFDNIFDDKWKTIDRVLNNYVHANGSRYVYNNYVHQKNSDKYTEELVLTLKGIVDIFLCILALIDSTKLASSDYRDSIEVGEKPLEGCQYWVMPSVVEYLNSRIDRKILEYIQEHEKYGMMLLHEQYE